MKLEKTSSMRTITKKTIDDFNSMNNDKEFLYKYACKKITYFNRVKKYGDPYMNAPLAKLAKFLKKHGF